MISPVETRCGSISIVSHESYYIGDDLYECFHKRIQLANGENIQIDPFDFTCKVQIITDKPDDAGSFSQITFLPCSLFERARTDNRSRVLFSLDNIQYNLSLVPFVKHKPVRSTYQMRKEFMDSRPDLSNSAFFLEASDNIIFIEPDPTHPEVSFDDCIKYVFKHPRSKEFQQIRDIPQEFFALELHWYKDFQRTDKYFFSFSPETQRIYLEQPGAHPLNLTTHPLNLFCFEESGDSIEIDVKGHITPLKKVSTIDGISIDEEGISIVCSCAGSGDSPDTIEILLDRGRLFIMIDQVALKEFELKTTIKFGIIDSLFHPSVLKGREIDTKNIIATRKMGTPDATGNRPNVGVLGIHFPFVKQSTTETVMNNSTESMNCTVPMNVSSDELFGICYEPLWEKSPLVFQHTRTKGWQGTIPLEANFKFVIMDKLTQQVKAWEMGENRHCSKDFYDASNGIMNLPSDSIAFPTEMLLVNKTVPNNDVISPDKTIDCKVSLDIGFDNNSDLGIASEPTSNDYCFESFESTDSKTWKGDIPFDKDFKFVRINPFKNFEIVEWETGPTRRYDKSTYNNAEPIEFSSGAITFASQAILPNIDTPSNQKAINCTLALDVGFGNVVGICYEPSWEKNPTLFEYAETQGWKGEIPLNRNFKFVKVDYATKQIIAWETGEGRQFNEDFYNATDDGSIHLNSAAVTFTSQVALPNTNASSDQKAMHCTLSLDVGLGNMVGICYAPSWEKNPTFFEYVDGQGWKGEIPLNTNFKFVKVDYATKQIIAWETGEERHYDESAYNHVNGSMQLTSDAVKFA